jgi:hypothetical protein
MIEASLSISSMLKRWCPNGNSAGRLEESAQDSAIEAYERFATLWDQNRTPPALGELDHNTRELMDHAVDKHINSEAHRDRSLEQIQYVRPSKDEMSVGVSDLYHEFVHRYEKELHDDSDGETADQPSEADGADTEIGADTETGADLETGTDPETDTDAPFFAWSRSRETAEWTTLTDNAPTSESGAESRD